MIKKFQILSFSILLLCFSLPLVAQIDLELTMAQSVAQAEQWTNYSIDLTVKNVGVEDATGVAVEFMKPNGVVYVGANQYSTTQGSFDVFLTETWTVGALAPGAEATLTVNYFQLVEQTPVAYAQVSSANETDVDSTPDNGTAPTPNEDDEANNIPNSNPQINFTCPSDVEFNIPAGNGGICQGYALLPKPEATSTCAAGGLTITFEGFTVISGFIDINDLGTTGFCPGIHVTGEGQAMVTFSATDACGNTATCSFMVTQTLIYNTVFFENCPTTVQVTAEPGATGAIVNYTYPTILSFCGGVHSTTPANETNLNNAAYASGNFFPIGTYTVNMKAYCGSTVEANCTFQVEVLPYDAPPTDGMDLTLSMTPSVEQAEQWTNYSIELVVQNEGNETATGVEISFPKPDGITYVGNNQFELSQGSFDVNDGEIWTVGTILPSEKAILTVNYFQLVEATPAAYAQVIAANEMDVDSTPDNGTPPTPNEDDEASTSNAPPHPTCEIIAELDEFVCLDEGSPATNTDDIYGIVFTVTNGSAQGSWTASNGGVNPPFSGTYGEPYTLNGGNLFTANSTGGLILTIDLADDADPTCTTQLSWAVPGLNLCNDVNPPAGDVDLELVMSSSSTAPKQWSHYSITLEVTNAGSETVTGVVVDIPLPEGVKYEGGNEYDASQGSLNIYGDHHWTVGEIPGERTATIVINYFLTAENFVSHYAQVAAQDQLDVDSSPGNGVCCMPVEDDEAAFEYMPSQFRLTSPAVGEFLYFPNPVAESVTINLASVPTATSIKIYNALGREVMEQKLDPSEFDSLVTLNTSNLINGTYYLHVIGDGFKARGKVMFVQRTY